MKPMCAAIRLGCLCAGLLVGFGANADWQFSNYTNGAGQKTCSAILTQGHTFDAATSAFQLPRGTLEMFRDEGTVAVRMANGDDPMMPVIAFHWLYPRGDAEDDITEVPATTAVLWDPRSQVRMPSVGEASTLLTREWEIGYEVRDSYGGLLVAETADAPGVVERLGDVMVDPADANRLIAARTIADGQYRQYQTDPAWSAEHTAAYNSSYWWDIPPAVLSHLTGSAKVTLKVNFPGHGSFAPTGSRHPVAVEWNIADGDKAAHFITSGPGCASL